MLSIEVLERHLECIVDLVQKLIDLGASPAGNVAKLHLRAPKLEFLELSDSSE